MLNHVTSTATYREGRGTKRLAIGLVGVLATLAMALRMPSASATDLTPPPQPASGPGGQGYLWSGAQVTFHTNGTHDLDYWIYQPTGWQGGDTAPSTAPVIIFLHGWSGSEPNHTVWLTHLARKGNVVVFPRWQSRSTPESSYIPNALWSVKDGLAHLVAAPGVRPDNADGLYIGYSAGGHVVTSLANRHVAEGLPTPKAVLTLMGGAGAAWGDQSFEGIPSAAKVVCVVGDQDWVVGRNGCDALWDDTGHIPAGNRNYVWMFGDSRGTSDLVTDHFPPSEILHEQLGLLGAAEPTLAADHLAPSEGSCSPLVCVIDALDWYGVWKLADGLRDCSIYGTNCSYALGNTFNQRYMGNWSDGVAVRQLQVTTTKPPCPAGSGASGCWGT